MDALIARLCVLYEDLRIELFAVRADSIPSLDVLDPAGPHVQPQEVGKYRRHYFVRRSIGTLYEFAEAIRLLNGDAEFKTISTELDNETAGTWRRGVEFFAAREILIEKVRNDVGGHFGLKAALFAQENLSASASGKIEFFYDDKNLPRDPHLNFAGDVAAAAFCRHFAGVTVREQVESFFRDVLCEGYERAADAVQILLALHVWPRFG